MIIRFLNFEKEVQWEEISGDTFDIDFQGQLMVQFVRQIDGTILAKNAVDGYGFNRQEEYYGIQPDILD